MQRSQENSIHTQYSDMIKEQTFDKDYKARLEKRKRMQQEREERIKKRYNGD